MAVFPLFAVYYGKNLTVGSRDYTTAVAVSRAEPYQPAWGTKRYLHHVDCPVFVAVGDLSNQLNRSGICGSCVIWKQNSFNKLQSIAKANAVAGISMETAFRGMVTFPHCVTGAHVRTDTLSPVRRSLAIMNSCAQRCCLSCQRVLLEVFLCS